MKAKSLEIINDIMWEMKDDKALVDRLMQIIRIETPTSKAGKFDIFKYVAKDNFRPVMTGVFHNGGFKVASDSHILVAFKDGYDEGMEGRILLRDGSLLPTDDGKYPRWKSVIPSKNVMESHKIDFAKLDEALSDDKVQRRAGKISGNTYVLVGKSYFKIKYMKLLAEFMKAIGTDEVYVNPYGRRVAMVTNGESVGILMPVMVDENDVNIQDENGFVIAKCYDL